MTRSTYQDCKALLLQMAKAAKAQMPNDKPAIRQTINDYADSLCKDYRLTERERDWLALYACKLHPKSR